MSTAKTEAPTPQRIRELRRKGDVPLSRELTKTAAMLGGLLALAATGPRVVSELTALARASAAGAFASPVEALVVAGALLVSAALPIAAAGAVAAVAAGGVQTGLVFAPNRILPQSNRFQPGQAWRARLRKETWISGGIALVAALLGALAAALGVRSLVASAESSAELAQRGPFAVLGPVVDALAVMGAAWIGVALVVAAIDVAWQRHAFMKRHAMSLQDIRDEYKRSEGDPQHKARRERAHRELLATTTREGVARADVVVVNPTHVAVGLRYRPDEAEAPVVTVSGRGDAAKAIKREARRRGVLEYTDRPVARAMVELEVGDEIPESLFEPVAIIFRWVAELRGDT